MTTHDTAQATDAKVEELKILLPPEIGRYDNDAYQATLLRAYVPGILARLDASEKRLAHVEKETERICIERDALAKENADLRAKVPQATQDDIDCAIEVCRFSDATTVDVVKGGAIIAAHIAPIRAQLDQAVGLLRDLQNDMLGATGPITWSEDCEMGKKGQPVDMHVAGDIRYRITERAKEKIDAFLATLSDKGDGK